MLKQNWVQEEIKNFAENILEYLTNKSIKKL